MPCRAGWLGPTVLLCVYGFCSMMRPLEPFMTEFLTGAGKNLTTEQVTQQVYPVWAYSTLVLLVPVLLVTDVLRYKPVIVLQGLTYVAAFLLVLVGPGLRWVQLAFLSYGVATAADVAYFSYLYVVVRPSHYQRVTGYTWAAMLLGYAAGALAAQLLVSLGGVALHWLGVVSLVSVSVAATTSFFLPMPETGRQLMGESSAPQEDASGDAEDSTGAFVWVKISKAARSLRGLLRDCRACYSSPAVLFLCAWAATGRCGFYQVASYVQVLWEAQQPQNFTAYNGAVDAVSTLSGAAASIAAGHASVQWSVWAELVLGVFTFLLAGATLLMDLTRDIWVSYACYFLFKTVYMQLATICTFQIASMLSRERYALVFGINSLAATALRSLLTAIVINTKHLQLTITSQFLIYAAYFAAIWLLFTVRGALVVLRRRRPPSADPPGSTVTGPKPSSTSQEGSGVHQSSNNQ